MQTITFYSYKGGVGRTLLIANAARFLARSGKRVFALDLDLEAPGLAYKLEVNDPSHFEKIRGGVVDRIYAFTRDDETRWELGEYVLEVEPGTDAGGSIHLLPAGAGWSASYWNKLAGINWHDLFYSQGGQGGLGVLFFLDLQERIGAEFRPDYLLVDSGTGVTEFGGVATKVLPDKVVCMMLNSREHLEGARKVLRAIQRAPRPPRRGRIAIFPVLSRLPDLGDPEWEAAIVRRIQAFFAEDAEVLSASLGRIEIDVLHSAPELEVEEVILVGSGRKPEDCPLLHDYLRLFRRLLPESEPLGDEPGR